MITDKEWKDIQEAVDTSQIFYEFSYRVHLTKILEAFRKDMKPQVHVLGEKIDVD